MEMGTLKNRGYYKYKRKGILLKKTKQTEGGLKKKGEIALSERFKVRFKSESLRELS